MNNEVDSDAGTARTLASSSQTKGCLPRKIERRDKLTRWGHQEMEAREDLGFGKVNGVKSAGVIVQQTVNEDRGFGT